MTDLISFEEIADAQARVAAVAHRTPLVASASCGALAGRPFLAKFEQLQRTGSFKFRGAYNLVSRLPENQIVIAASAGNHAQGVALAASLTGRRAVVFMPESAAQPKVEATRSYGAEVRFAGAVLDETIRIAEAEARSIGAAWVPPFDDRRIIAGQATLGLELAEEAPLGSTVAVPVGGGGLISGVATALAALRPDMRVVGVQAAGAASMQRSLDAGRPVAIPSVNTIADGIALKTPSRLTLAHVAAHVDELVTVDDDQICSMLLLLLQRAKVLVEPAGAAAAAALCFGTIGGDGPAVAILSGGNIDQRLLVRLLNLDMGRSRRFLTLRATIPDHPGGLALLTGTIASTRANVVSVAHHRSAPDRALDDVEVIVTLETTGEEHAGDVMDALGRAGIGATRFGTPA